MQRDAVCMAQEGCGTKNQIPPRNNSMFYHKVSNTCQELPRLHETWETTYSPNPHPHHSKHSTRRQVCFLCLLAPSLGGPRSRVAWLPPSAATSILDDLENQPPGVSFLLWKWEGDSQASSVTHSPCLQSDECILSCSSRLCQYLYVPWSYTRLRVSSKDSARKSSEEPHIVRAFKRQERLLLAAVYPLLVLLPQHIRLDLHRACGIPFRSLSVLTQNCMYQYSTATRVKWHTQ